VAHFICNNHSPEKYNEEEYRVHVFVKIIKKLPEPSLGTTIAEGVLSAFLNRKKLITVLVALSF